MTEQDNRSFPQNTVFPNGYEELRDSLVVVARSWENIDWLHGCKRPFVVYNKGEHDIPFPANCLPNIGRDCHTYLQYIVENYYNLRDYTFFIQGDPFEKYPGIMNVLIRDDWNTDTINILCTTTFVEEFHGYPSGPMQGMKKLLKDIGLYENEHMMHVFGMGTQYIVHKKFIQSKSLNWWKNVYQVYIGEGDEEHMRQMAYRFEKIFLKIFMHTECHGFPIKEEP